MQENIKFASATYFRRSSISELCKAELTDKLERSIFHLNAEV